MENSDIFNQLPDAVCIIDSIGNVQRSNIQFENLILKSVAAVNFLTDVLHSQHQEKIGLTMENMQTDGIAENHGCRVLGVLNTLTMSERSQKFPVYRLIDWSISCMSGGDSFILSGREPSHSDKSFIKTCDLLKPKSNQPFDDMTSELIDFFQNAPIALHWLSGTGVILWANNTELQSMGYSADEYIGHSITEFLMPGEEVHLQEVFGNLAAGRTIHDKPFLFRAKNGDTKYLIVDSNVNFNEDGSFRHTRCFIRNDTDRRVKEEILLASNRIMKQEADAKSTFIRHVFHEMRTPLHVLSSFLSSFNPTAEDFDEMRHHTDSTLGMVDDLTFATTFEAGKLSPMDPRPLHLSSVLLQVKDAVNVVEQKGGRSVEIRFHSEQLNKENENVLADPCLSRIIYSMLSNAVRYSPATGDHIDFTVTYSPNIADSSTTDTPVGSKRSRDLSPDVVEHTSNENNRTPAAQRTGSYTFCFRNSTVTPMDLTLVRNYFRYYYHFDALAFGKDSVSDEKESIGNFLRTTGSDISGERSSTGFSVGVGGLTRSHVTNSGSYKDLTSTKGLGLGLYTAYNMVKLMGGQLECSAENGTEASFWFTLSLPLSAPQQASSKIAKILSPFIGAPSMKAIPVVIQDDDSNLRQIRVLVVDDSSMCQKVIVKSLKGIEFITDTASNGREACDKLEEVPCKFDAVLMDLRMPIMDGLEAIRYCRQVLMLNSLPIVALTAEIGVTIREEAMQAGATHFLNKPAKGQEIIGLLRSLMPVVAV